MFKQIEWKILEKWPVATLAGLGAIGLLLMGLFPNWVLSMANILLKSFSHLNN